MKDASTMFTGKQLLSQNEQIKVQIERLEGSFEFSASPDSRQCPRQLGRDSNQSALQAGLSIS